MEKQKTPLAQLKEEIDILYSLLPDKAYGSKGQLEVVKLRIDALLPTEREVFENVYLDGCLENIDVTKPIEYGAYFDSKFIQS
jgi:hypothetical protein